MTPDSDGAAVALQRSVSHAARIDSVQAYIQMNYTESRICII